MPSQQPLVSVIIPHYAGTEILIQCLATLNSSSVEPEFEVILVDNASSDGSVVEAQRKFPNIRVLHLDENQGYAGGCNRGIEVARGKYVMLLNDDTEIDAACVSELAQTAEKDPTVAACQPKIRSLREPSQFEYSGAAGGLMDVYGYPFSRGRLMDDVEVDEGQYDEPVEIFWASGVCMFIRKQVLDEVGAFDETFFAYMEEIDLSWRFHLAGHRVVYVPTAVVYHIGGYSLERKNVRRMFLNHRNSMIMLFKNYSARSLRCTPAESAALTGGSAFILVDSRECSAVAAPARIGTGSANGSRPGDLLTPVLRDGPDLVLPLWHPAGDGPAGYRAGVAAAVPSRKGVHADGNAPPASPEFPVCLHGPGPDLAGIDACHRMRSILGSLFRAPDSRRRLR
ncbi:MAG: glycosyltransferase family 2 protein [Deltaproteobacteria bacterium]|nr:glycosyltransferase family 2 protein [Deltaproteobacteria bacterium]